MATDMKNEDTHDRIELRSEKVRKILGDIPRSLVAWGYIVLAVVTIGIIIAIFLFPEFTKRITKF